VGLVQVQAQPKVQTETILYLVLLLLQAAVAGLMEMVIQLAMTVALVAVLHRIPQLHLGLELLGKALMAAPELQLQAKVVAAEAVQAAPAVLV